MVEILKYKDDTDKAYGLAGMAVSLMVFDDSDTVAEISMDAPAGETIRFSPSSDMGSNPAFPAKMAWNSLLRQYNLAMGLMIGNVLSRSFIYQSRDVLPEVYQAMRDTARSEGAEQCSLVEEEADAVFSRTYRMFSNVFTHPRVGNSTRHLVECLRRQRSMSTADIFEQLSDIADLF
ncbi:MAG: hypothetical protein K2M79_00110 [Muribaculaceae bacterium]|nr:hypothetical protein [Muribaculaceae bacterium]